MESQHVGWKIVRVNGQTICPRISVAAALDATRFPHRTFTLTVQQPLSGDITVDEADLHASACRVKRYIDPTDLAHTRFSFGTSSDGSTLLRVSMPERLAEMVQSHGIDFTRAVLSTLEQLSGLREELSQEEKAELEEEEREAAMKDQEAADDSERCGICMVNKRVVVLLPCKHHISCHRCSVLLYRRGRCHGTCPICRQQIEDMELAGKLNAGDYFDCCGGDPPALPGRSPALFGGSS